jgi:hypothetical protein
MKINLNIGKFEIHTLSSCVWLYADDLWSIRAQLENLPAEIIELIKEHTLKV